jgi:ABC-2 type transport system ATP-binding protein
VGGRISTIQTMATQDLAPISVLRLSKSFGRVKALTDVSFTVPRNSVYALIGANGTGKSTLMRLLLHIHRATSGESSILGVASRELRARHFERIGYLAESHHSPDWLTAEQYGEWLQPFYPRWDVASYTHLCRRLRVPASRRMEAMSRGTRMKTLLCGVLAFQPECLLLDEPLGGLDPLAREEIVEVLRESARGTTILISSHDLFEIELLATHIGYLDEGRLLFSEPVVDLRARFNGMSLRDIFLNLARASVSARTN